MPTTLPVRRPLPPAELRDAIVRLDRIEHRVVALRRGGTQPLREILLLRLELWRIGHRLRGLQRRHPPSTADRR